MGSFSEPSSPCSFALDLAWYSKLTLVIVQIAGRTRDLPSKIDSVLTVSKPVDANEILTERWLHFSNQQSPQEGNSDEEEEGGFGNTSTNASSADKQERSVVSDDIAAAATQREGSAAASATIEQPDEEEGTIGKYEGKEERNEEALSVPLLRDFNGGRNEIRNEGRAQGSRVTFSEVENK